MAELVIPWNKPGYLIGPHPLVQAYLTNRPSGSPIFFETKYDIQNISENLSFLKRSLVKSMIQLQVHNDSAIQIDSWCEYIANRNELNITELFPDRDGLVFNHAAIYPQTSNYIQHYENPISLFYPFLWFGQVNVDFPLKSTPIYDITKRVLESDNCKFLFSHMDCFVKNLNTIFDSEIIRNKNFLIRPPIGVINKKPSKKIKRVMFSNSFNTSDSRFYLRGGLAAIKSFAKVSKVYPDIEFVILSNIPNNIPIEIANNLNDTKNINIFSQGMTESEINDLCKDVDVLVNPSTGLHSMTVLRGMASGSLVISSDVYGYNEYINHGVNGILLSGIGDLVNSIGFQSDLILEHYPNLIEFNMHIEEKLSFELFNAIANEEHSYNMRIKAIEYIQTNFSIGSPCCDLWSRLDS